MSKTPSSGSPTPGSNSSSGSPATDSNSSSTGSPTPTLVSNSSSGSPSPPPYPGSMLSDNESRPSSPHAPPFNSKQAPGPSTDPTPATPASPPADSGSSPPSSPSPPPPQQSAPPTPTPATTPPPTQATTTPQVSPPPAPVSSTSTPPSTQSPPVSNPPQQTSPPSSGSSPPTGQLPTPNSPPTNQTPVVPSPYLPPSPANSGPPSPMVPSPPNSTPSPPGFNSSGSSPIPTTPGSSSTPPTGSTPAGGSGSSSSPKSGSTSDSSHHHDNSSSAKSPTSSMSTTGLAIVGAAAVVIIIAVIAMLFLFCKRKKRRVGTFAPQYIPPNNFPQSDGYYYGQKAQPKESFYASQMQHSPPRTNGSYVSPGMNGYSGGPYSGGGYSGGGYSGADSDVIGGGKSFFSYEEVMEITNGFSRQNVIGEGGFGYVYKGQLPDGKLVAVKQLKAGGGQGDREFRAEVEIISRVHHRHLVSLVGYSIAEAQRLLIYEFVPNKTLEHHLHGKEMPLLDWSKRVKIALGSAKGLAYLHEDCHPKIIHRDIKSSNILLDDAFEAQVADFGLAKITVDTNTHVSTRVMGTFGYLAPEYATSGKLTDRSDVFSFGVVLLELITGSKPIDPSRPLGDESLVEWARPLLIHALETGDFSEIVDPRLEKHYVESEMIRMIEAAAACIRHNASKRPRMAQVVRALDNGGEMSDLTNGVKFGQSTAYDSGQYSEDIKRFNRMAHGEDNSLDYGMYSGDYTSREVPSETTQSSWKSRDTSEFTSGELETKAINPVRQTRMGQEVYSDRRFK